MFEKLYPPFAFFWSVFYRLGKNPDLETSLLFTFMLFFALNLSKALFSFIQSNCTMLKKYLLSAVSIGMALTAGAQTLAPHNMPKVAHLKPVPFNKQAVLPETFTPDLINPNEFIGGSIDRNNSEELVAVTRWDAHGYGCVPSRVYYKPNGEPVSTYTFATDGADAYPERGTGYSTRSGGTWNANPARIESVRTGFPSASILDDGTEVAIAHGTSVTPYILRFMRKAPGATSWTESNLPTPAGQGCLWPHLVTSGNNIHVIAITTPTGNNGTVYEGINGHILYWRSTDGGLTWDKQFVKIPGLDNTKYTAHGADEYAIDVNGSTVAVAAFPAWNDLQVFKSFDNGDTWETLLVNDFPDALENYAGADGDSYTIDDIGDPDPNAPDSLAVFSSDGSGNLLVDASGEVHVFFGEMYYSDTDPAAGSSFYPGINGLLHWKESFGTDNFQLIGGALDYDGDGSLGITAIAEIAPYYMSLASMPSSGASADGTIYVGYAALHELYRSSNTDQQFFRHVYLVKSSDNGESWGDPLDIIAAPFISDTVLIPFVENVYPMLPRHIGSNVGLVYQQDYDPGIHLLGPTAAGNHPFVDNNLLWVEVDPTAIPGTSSVFTPDANPTLDLALTPNPASSQTLLTATLSGKGDVTVEVFDMMGKRVYQNNMPSVEGRQQLVLPAQQWVNGAYWVRLSEGNQFGITRLVVAK